MRQKSGTGKAPAEQVIKDIRRATRKQYGAEEKIRIVLEGLRGEESIAALCRREGIAESLYYTQRAISMRTIAAKDQFMLPANCGEHRNPG